jgi:DNA-binding response OmpR family regulator
MAKRILSISYDESLLLTRRFLLDQAGFEVLSALGFVEAIEACDAANQLDLIILGHSIPPKDKNRIMAHIKEHCSVPVLALLWPHQDPVPGAHTSIEATAPDTFMQIVRKIVEADHL